MMPVSLRDHVRQQWPRWLGEPAPRDVEGVVLSRGAVLPARATAFVFADRERAPRIVLKIAFRSEGWDFLAHEHRSLQAVHLRAPGLSDSVPVPYGLDGVGPFIVESMAALAGVQLSLPRLDGRSRRAARKVTTHLTALHDWSDALARATAGEAEHDERELSERIEAFASEFDVQGRARLRLTSFRTAVERSRIRWSPCWQHGDLTAGNILFHRRRPGVVDWELSGPAYEPWFDAAYSWLSLVLLHQHRNGYTRPGAALPSLWSPECWLTRAAGAELSSRWRQPLPMQWALAATAVATALRARKSGRSGASRWADLALSMLDDDTVRTAAPDWVPQW